MTVLLDAFNKSQCLSAAGPVSSLMITEYKCSGRQENPDHPLQWQENINLKSILQVDLKFHFLSYHLDRSELLSLSEDNPSE